MSVDVGTGGRVLPEHAAWVGTAGRLPTPQPQREGGADRAVLFGMIALYLVGAVVTCWFLFVP